MKASQTQATSPKVSSPFQRCPEGKWRSRTSATFRRRKVASRTGISSTRSTRCTCGGSVFMPHLLFRRPFVETPTFLSRTASLGDDLVDRLGDDAVVEEGRGEEAEVVVDHVGAGGGQGVDAV